MWALEIVDFVLPGDPLDAFGIRPRVPSGLIGIVFAPFLHHGFPHLIANSIPFLILGLLVSSRRASDFPTVFFWSALIGGLGTWLFAFPNTIHIGASGVVFGMFGYLVARGFIERSLPAIALSLISMFLYGGMFWALIWLRSGISWSGHLFGFLGGIVAASVMSRR